MDEKKLKKEGKRERETATGCLLFRVPEPRPLGCRCVNTTKEEEEEVKEVEEKKWGECGGTRKREKGENENEKNQFQLFQCIHSDQLCIFLFPTVME